MGSEMCIRDRDNVCAIPRNQYVRLMMRFESPARGLSYHADNSRYIILAFLLLNHYAWMHEQYTPAWGGNTHTQNPPRRVQHPQRRSNTVLPVSCSYSIQSHISTRRSVDQNPCVSIPKPPPCSRQDCDHENGYESRRMNNKQANQLSIYIDPESSKSPDPRHFCNIYQEHSKAKQFKTN